MNMSLPGASKTTTITLIAGASASLHPWSPKGRSGWLALAFVFPLGIVLAIAVAAR